MLHWLHRLRIITVGDVGWWHGRRGYPRQVHGVAVPLHNVARHSATADADESSVTPLRSAGDTSHG